MHKQLFEWCCFIKPSGRIENPQHAIKVQILSSSMKLSFLLLPLNKKSEPKLSSTTSFCKVRSLPLLGSNGWYVLNIHFSIELVLKLIQFNIHSKLKPKFKTNIHFFKSRIFIQSNYWFFEKSRIFIQSNYSFFEKSRMFIKKIVFLDTKYSFF